MTPLPSAAVGRSRHFGFASAASRGVTARFQTSFPPSVDLNAFPIRSLRIRPNYLTSEVDFRGVGGVVRAGGSLKKIWDERLQSRPFYASVELTDGGLLFGAGTVLAPMRKDHCGAFGLDVARDRDRILALLGAAYGRPVPVSVLRHIDGASNEWRRGDKALANIRLAYARLPRFERRDDAYPLFLAASLLKSGCGNRPLIRLRASSTNIIPASRACLRAVGAKAAGGRRMTTSNSPAKSPRVRKNEKRKKNFPRQSGALCEGRREKRTWRKGMAFRFQGRSLKIPSVLEHMRVNRYQRGHPHGILPLKNGRKSIALVKKRAATPAARRNQERRGGTSFPIISLRLH